MQNSKIEWTDHTFNPWWGCQRVSPGCQNCYAETLAHRYGHEVWGPAKTTPRRAMSENYWKQPHRWNKAAGASGVRARVFCASMADVFEDHPLVAEWRIRLFELIGSTIHLDWLLLTKRPENILGMLPANWGGNTLINMWIGTSCEDQQRADERIPHLLRVPARVRFLSCEPLLGPITFRPRAESTADMLRLMETGEASKPTMLRGIHWLIVGGESGHGARPMHPDWARSLRDQAQAAGVAFFFKQHGEYIHENQIWRDHWTTEGIINPAAYNALMNGKQDIADRGWQHKDRSISYHVGKHAAGRLLDGVEHNAYPV